ncbi:SGNH hydrolase-type esterase domain-containing protein [Xylaria sp. FL1042]|nr:SGNH hydrolase-type esterase domain-containing protein [Xylaria sp. FL1042]
MLAGMMKFKLLSAAACLLWITCVSGSPLGIQKLERKQDADSHWVATWTSMPQLVEQSNLPPSPFTGSGVFKDATLRQTLHMSIGAERIRIQISNTFGGSALPITAASLAFPTGGAAGISGIDTATLRGLTFNGSSSVSIPQGQVVYTDPIDVKIAPQSMITVTLYSQAGQSGTSITGHPGSRTTSYMQQGNHVNASTVTGASTAHWYFLNVVEAWAPKSTVALVILGDSITDGRGSTDNMNNRLEDLPSLCETMNAQLTNLRIRWPDLLLARMQKENVTNIAVVNQAAGGNAVLTGGLGPPLLQRYKRDLLATAGVKYGLIFEGVNDIGGASADSGTQSRIGSSLDSAFKTIATDAKAAGITMFGATITPFGGSGQAYSSPVRDSARQAVNKWILDGGDGSFAASVDFAKFLANPSTPANLAAQYDSGDHLHPNPAGYQAIADQFPLTIFK